MKFTVYKLNVKWNTMFFEDIEIECEGNGTKIDPMRIESSESLPNSFHIKKSDLFIIVKNCANDFINLNSCKNITITNCKIKNCIIESCKDVNIRNTLVYDTLKIHESRNIKVEDSNIKNLKFKESNSNFIIKCKVRKIREIGSKENVFEDLEPYETE